MQKQLHPAATAAVLLCFPPIGTAQHGATLHEEEPVHLDAVVVTPFPNPRAVDDFAQPVHLTQGDRLHRRTEPTLGESLSGVPGVSSTWFGPGSSRPIIRGFNADRIRVLTNGVGTLDVSVISPDHAVSAEPMFAERVEVVRGPATLLYGSSALGGVVNMVDPSLPDTPPEKQVSGEAGVRYGFNNEERVGSIRLHGGNDNFGLYASGLKRTTDDISIPVPPENEIDREEKHDEDHEEDVFDGTLPNSSAETESFILGPSAFWDSGYIGVAYTHYTTLYGIPGGHDYQENEEEEPIRVDLQQDRVLLRAAVIDPASWLSEINLRAAVADYEHAELEGDEIGTVFATSGIEARLSAVHAEIGDVAGAFGIEVSSVDLEAAGLEAFLPPTETRKWSLFLVETWSPENATIEFGTRLEDQQVDITDGTDRSTDATSLSLALGCVWRFSDNFSAALSIGRTERLPNAQELYADGPHAATRAYEIGDAGLQKETAWSADLVLRKRTGKVTGQLSLFTNRIDGYIFEQFTGEEEDGLPVYRFVARDAEFIGGELETVYHAHESGDFEIDLKLMVDAVRATNTTTDEPLPRIPPVRFGMGFDVARNDWSFGAEALHAAAHTRTAPLETPTEKYTLISAYLAYDFMWAETSWSIYARATNLGDQEARPSTSFLKDVAPLPGRNLVLGLRMAF